MYSQQVTVNEVCLGHIIKYKVTVNNVPVNALYDTGASLSCLVKSFLTHCLLNLNSYHMTGILQVQEARHRGQ